MFRTYTETYDLNTEVGYPCILGIHSPIGTTPYRMLEPCFKMYKKYKYLGCDVTVVNSARLPADPEQVGKVSGTNYISPKDLLDPVLFKGCHGESLGKILDSMYNGILGSLDHNGPSIDKDAWAAAFENFYYTALGDDSWRKSPIQKTLNLRGLHPLVYNLAIDHQVLPANSLEYDNYSENNSNAVTGNPGGLGNSAGCDAGRLHSSLPNGWSYPVVTPTYVEDMTKNPGGSYRTGLASLFTNKMMRLGWLDTFQFLGQNADKANAASDLYNTGNGRIAQLPKLFMGMLMLPPAHLCRQYLRVIIRHKFRFSQYRSITEGSSSSWTGNIIGYGDWLSGNSSKDVVDPDDRCIEDAEDVDD